MNAVDATSLFSTLISIHHISAPGGAGVGLTQHHGVRPGRCAKSGHRRCKGEEVSEGIVVGFGGRRTRRQRRQWTSQETSSVLLSPQWSSQ